MTLLYYSYGNCWDQVWLNIKRIFQMHGSYFPWYMSMHCKYTRPARWGCYWSDIKQFEISLSNTVRSVSSAELTHHFKPKDKEDLQRPQYTIVKPVVFLLVTVYVCLSAGLSLVVGLVLYISSINDEVMNRPREPEQFFHYHYGWSFAFAASSFLLKEVSVNRGHTHTRTHIDEHLTHLTQWYRYTPVFHIHRCYVTKHTLGFAGYLKETPACRNTKYWELAEMRTYAAIQI